MWGFANLLRKVRPQKAGRKATGAVSQNRAALPGFPSSMQQLNESQQPIPGRVLVLVAAFCILDLLILTRYCSLRRLFGGSWSYYGPLKLKLHIAGAIFNVLSGALGLILHPWGWPIFSLLHGWSALLICGPTAIALAPHTAGHKGCMLGGYTLAGIVWALAGARTLSAAGLGTWQGTAPGGPCSTLTCLSELTQSSHSDWSQSLACSAPASSPLLHLTFANKTGFQQCDQRLSSQQQALLPRLSSSLQLGRCQSPMLGSVSTDAWRPLFESFLFTHTFALVRLTFWLRSLLGLPLENTPFAYDCTAYGATLGSMVMAWGSSGAVLWGGTLLAGLICEAMGGGSRWHVLGKRECPAAREWACRFEVGKSEEGGRLCPAGWGEVVMPGHDR